MVDVRSGRSSPTCAAPSRARRPRRRTRASCSSRRPTRCSCAARSPPAARTRCRAAAGCSTGSTASASCCVTCAARPTSSSTRRPQRAPARAQGRHGVRAATTRRAAGDRGVVRLQVRHAGRRRHRARHALPAQSVLGARAARRGPGSRLRVSDYVLGQPRRRRSSSTATSALLETVADGLPARGQAVRQPRHRLHRRQAPQRRDGRGARPAAAERGIETPSCTGTWGASDDSAGRRDPWPSVADRSPGAAAVVALGGGHGLAASLRRTATASTDRLTAVVTVADDGGSRGGCARELGVLPPGDLRMALAALCGDDELGPHLGRRAAAPVPERRRAARPRGRQPADRRRSGSCWATTVEGLDWVGRLLGAEGRVLPMAAVPLDIEAEVRGADPDGPTSVDDGAWPGRRWRRRPDWSVGASSSPPTRPPARRRSRRSMPPTGWSRARVVVHQCDAAPAGARAARRPCRDRRPAMRDAEPGAAAG